MLKCLLLSDKTRSVFFQVRRAVQFRCQDRDSHVFLSVSSSPLLAGGAVTSLLSVSPMCRSGGSSSVRVSLSPSQPTHACR